MKSAVVTFRFEYTLLKFVFNGLVLLSSVIKLLYDSPDTEEEEEGSLFSLYH